MDAEQIGDCVWLVQMRGKTADAWYWVEVCNNLRAANRSLKMCRENDPRGIYRVAHFTIVAHDHDDAE